jgi:hypothetical protein
MAALCRNKMPGLECVPFSRATALEHLVVIDDNEITYDMILKIGKGEAYQKQYDYELQLMTLSSTTQAPIIEKAATYKTTTKKTFYGGWVPSFDSLL